MAYTHTQYEVMVASDGDLSSTADIGDWAPGFVPHIIRAVAIVVTNDIGATATVKVDKRPTAGSDTSRGDGDIADIDLTTDHDQGNVVYQTDINVKVSPGEEAVVEVTDAAAGSDTAHVVFLVEPTWEEPGNNDDMVATA